jgi:23S rRNA pseudoU1915 N3-methylase RlmH
MKNIHILPTEQPSRFSLHTTGLYNLACELHENSPNFSNHHIYITSDEQGIKGDYVIHTPTHKLIKVMERVRTADFKKVVLTTDPKLIADGIQAIDDEFLEWFVKNPTCEFVEVVKEGYKKNSMIDEATSYKYKIIIPEEEPDKELNLIKEESKQLPLKEAAERLASTTDEFNMFIAGANYQAERMYAEADNIMRFLDTEVELKLSDTKTIERIKWYFKTYFEQFKKK